MNIFKRHTKSVEKKTPDNEKSTQALNLISALFPDVKFTLFLPSHYGSKTDKRYRDKPINDYDDWIAYLYEKINKKFNSNVIVYTSVLNDDSLCLHVVLPAQTALGAYAFVRSIAHEYAKNTGQDFAYFECMPVATTLERI